MPKKATKGQRKKKVRTQIEYVATRDTDVGFGGIPIKPAVIQQAQQQQIQGTISTTNQLLGRLKAQQLSIERELERTEKQKGAIVDKPLLKEIAPPLKEKQIQTEPNLPRTIGVRKAFSSGTSLEEDIESEARIARKQASINPKLIPKMVRVAQLEPEDLSLPMASSIRQQLEQEISSTSRAIIGRAGFMESETAGLPRPPASLRPVGQISRITRGSSLPEEQENISERVRARVLQEIRTENVDLRGFALGSSQVSPSDVYDPMYD